MKARQIARQFCGLGEVHSQIYGRRVSRENDRELTARTRTGATRRLMDYPGLYSQPGKTANSGLNSTFFAQYGR